MSQQSESFLAKASTKKKISFFSAVLVVMGSSIGAGIFFKSQSVLANSQNSLLLSIFSWLIASFSVAAMALSLVEVVSARNDNLSLLGWTKVFNKRWTFKASKNFMFYVYLPLNYFYMPLYVIMSMQDGVGALINKDVFTIGTDFDWLIWMFVSLSISLYFICVSGLYSKIGSIQNQIVTYIKFIPLVFVGLVGIILVGMNAGGQINIGTQPPTIETPSGEINDSTQAGASLVSLAPIIGVFLSLSAIFFAYDGFYVVAGIQTEIEEPKKTSTIILIGLVITTAIYLFLAVSMSINGGSFYKMKDYMTNLWGDTGRILFGIVSILIAIGVLGIINGFAMWGSRFTEDLIREGELPFSLKYKDKLNVDKPCVGTIYTLITAIPVTLIFSLIGSLTYIDSYGNYGTNVGRLYTFADLMGSWMSLFVFFFIVVSIFGAIKNRKTKNVVTEQKSYFLPMAWISTILVGIATVITVIMPIVDLFLVAAIDKELLSSAGRNYNDILISRIMLVITLFIFVGLTYGVTFLEMKYYVRKFGSIEKYEQWQKENFVQNY